MVEPGESIEDKERNLIDGIRRHYAAISAQAETYRTRPDLPILATGHLFASGGQTADGDGVRQLYVGSLAQVTADCFPDNIDYLALGHLHIPQKIGGSETRRYSGFPRAHGLRGTRRQERLPRGFRGPSGIRGVPARSCFSGAGTH